MFPFHVSTPALHCHCHLYHLSLTAEYKLLLLTICDLKCGLQHQHSAQFNVRLSPRQAA